MIAVLIILLLLVIVVSLIPTVAVRRFAIESSLRVRQNVLNPVCDPTDIPS